MLKPQSFLAVTFASIGISLSCYATVDSSIVRVTPPVSSVVGLETQQISLNGAWDFIKDLPDDFDPADTAGIEWASVEVPGHFTTQGFGRMHKEFGVPVAYRKTVSVPAEWAGKRVVLRFDSTEGLTTIYANGHEVLTRDTHFLPVEVDITDQVTPGSDAEIVLTIAYSSITQWWRPEKGGIRRDAWLMALPEVNVASFNITTDFDEQYDDATMRVHVKVANQSDQPADGTALSLQLTGPEGQAIDLGEHGTFELPAMSAGAVYATTIEVPIDSPAQWNTDFPRLHTLAVTLTDDDESLMTAERRFGFREIEVKGPRVLINGQVAKIRGINFHQTWPGTDYFTPAEKLREDMELFRTANLDYLRIWPSPDADVVDAADEMGLMMQVEVPISMFLYRGNKENNWGNQPEYGPILKQWAELIVEHYSSHPSVIIYSLGNESHYHEFFKHTAFYFDKLDPSRPVIFSGDQMTGVSQPGLDIYDDHYPRNGRIDFTVPGSIVDESPTEAKLGWKYPTQTPNMFTEWAHLPLGNWSERQRDPGIFDYFGWIAEAHMDYTLHHPHIFGGAIFTGTPVTAIHEQVYIGIYDPQRRINDAWWHVKKSNSPVRISTQGLPENPGISPAKFEVKNRGNFADLSDYTFRYRQGEMNGEAQVSGKPGTTSMFEVPVMGDSPDAVEIEVIGPRGFAVDQYRFETTNGGVQTTPNRPDLSNGQTLATQQGDDRIQIIGGGFSWDIDRATGMIQQGRAGEQVVVNGGPKLILTHSAHEMNHKQGLGAAIQDQLKNWTLKSIKVKERDNKKGVTVQVVGSFDQGNVEMEYRFDERGGLTIDYALNWTDSRSIDVFDAGLAIGFDKSFDTLSWRRDGQWNVYPEDHIGRLTGTTVAAGDPKWAEARTTVTEGQKLPWPWSQDMTEGGVTQDFRSTKRTVRYASLSNGSGAGLAVTSKGDQHVRMQPAEDRYWMHINTFWNGGTEYHLVKSVRWDALQTEPGLVIKDQVRLHLLPAQPTAQEVAVSQ